MVAGNALELDWGCDFDLILLPNFLHHFDFDTCTSLLRKVKASLAAGGQALSVDFVPNEDRVSPPYPVMFAFQFYIFSPSTFLVGPEKTRASYLRERKDAVYENLRDLNFEFKAGKMPEADYQSLKSSLQDEAATLLAEIARLEAKAASAPRKARP